MIGDGSMSAGMAYEAMNNAGATDQQLIVILNDNDMSIAPPVGGMSAYLARLVSGGGYRSIRKLGKRWPRRLPKPLQEAARKAEEYARGMVTGGTFFEELGFYYVGPIDGHDLDAPRARAAERARHRRQGPVLVHVVTQKGKGYAPAEDAGRQVPRRGQVRRGHRPAGQGGRQRAQLHQGVRRRADQARRARTTEDRGDHRRHAVGHRPRPLRQALPRAHASTSASPSSTR